VSGGLLYAAAGFLNRGDALSSIVLQVGREGGRERGRAGGSEGGHREI